jgi:RNA polymerase sigma-70 factor (ECF subfamily)
LDNLSDQEIIDRVLSGDDGAYGHLVKRYQRAVYSVARRYLRSHPAADDIAQETFLRAYSSLKGYDRRFRFYTWLIRITINLCHDTARREGRYLPLDGEREEAPGNPLETLVQEDACRRIRKEIAELPPDQREVILLRADRELSYQEIGQVLGIPAGTVMSRLFRGRQTLARRLKGII